jgi:DNA-binding transcriptional LysR family regulator
MVLLLLGERYAMRKNASLVEITMHAMHECMMTSRSMEALTVDWTLLRSFAAVMREGTLSAAAAATGQTQPTVGRHIRALEELLGEPLFERRGSAIMPVARASALYEHAARMEEAAFAIERMVAGADDAVSGKVRISVPEVFGTLVMPSILARFQQVHPAVSIEMAATNETDDLMRREADIAVRFFRPAQPDLVMQKVGEVRVGLFASPAYLERMGAPTGIADFARHRLIGDDTSDRILNGMRAMGLQAERSDFVYRSDSILAQIAAIHAGTGIGSALTLTFEGTAVQRILPRQIDIPYDVHVVAHGEVHRSRRIRLAFDFIAEGLKVALAQTEKRMPISKP